MIRGDGLTISLGPGKSIRRSYFGVFLILAGLAVLTWMTLLPLVRVFAARSWTPTPCTVVSSKLEGSADESGTHMIAINYDYIVEGQTYHGNRYQFVPPMPTAGFKGKQAVVAANPPGHETTCYVNPASPGDSVFERGATADFLWGLFSLPFFLIGGYIIAKDFRRGRSGATAGLPRSTDVTP